VTANQRREELLAKRDSLRAEQALRMARRQREEEVDAFHRGRGAVLDAAGVRYGLLWPEDERVGPLTAYPIGFASVRWDLVPHAVRVAVGTDNWIRQHFEEALLALGVAPDTELILDWCVGGTPRVRLRAADLCTHAVELLRSEAWVYEPTGTWLVEMHHDGILSHADGPGKPEHAGDGWRRSIPSP
jgi:hypothetical protein